MGADRAAPSDDPIEAYLLEPNVWPDETLLPGWRIGALDYYTAMEEIGRLVMSAIARYLGLAEGRFERDFTTGVSTLRLVHMIDRIQEDPVDTQGRYRAVIDGKIRRLSRASHTDSGVLTLLWQPGDLQAQAPDGSWLDVPVVPGSLTVNFGDCMALWTSGRIQAAHHRVLARPGERWSVPFFYEPDASTEIVPLFESAPSAHPVRYGEHVLARIRASDIATADHVAA